MKAKNSLCLMAAMALTQFANLAMADASHCYSINNRDAKNFCLAQAKQEKSYCYSISDRDQKNLCLAVVGNEKSYCYSISSRDDKNSCLAKF